MWLCERCAELVDKNGGADFSVSDLKLWKIASEKAALERLYRHSDAVRDNCVTSLIFINVPRLRHYVALSNQGSWRSSSFDEGIPAEGYIAPELHRFETAIGQLHFPSLEWREAVKLVDDPTGMMVSFEGIFRTKNGPRGRRDRQDRDFTNLNTAPHVYQKDGSLKLILPYDPKYVTTSTATVELTRGQTRIGGFALIKQRNGNEIIASPYIMGLASTPEVRAFWNSMRTSMPPLDKR